MVRSRERGRGTPVREPTKILPSPRRRRQGWATATRPRHVVRSSAEVVTHQVCAQGARSGVSARGRATAGVGSETAGGGLANATARPPRCSAASIALARQHRTPSCPAGAGGAAMSPEKSKWRAPRNAVAGPPAAAAFTQPALPRCCFASGGRRRTWAACGSRNLPLCRAKKCRVIALCTIGL